MLCDTVEGWVAGRGEARQSGRGIHFNGFRVGGLLSSGGLGTTPAVAAGVEVMRDFEPAEVVARLIRQRDHMEVFLAARQGREIATWCKPEDAHKP